MTPTLTTDDLVEIAAVRALCRAGYARWIREEAGITATELAKALAVTTGAVSRWESGERLPRADVAMRYAALLRRLLHAIWNARFEAAAGFRP